MLSHSKRELLVLLAVIVLVIGWLVHPVCIRLSETEVSAFGDVPIEKRTDRDVFFFSTFQRRQGHWCQCKSWISRQFFF